MMSLGTKRVKTADLLFVYLLFPCHGGGGAEEVNKSAVLRNEDDNQFGT